VGAGQTPRYGHTVGRVLAARKRGTLSVVGVVAVLAFLGCSTTATKGGANKVTASGHLEWIGGPPSVPNAPASGVRLRVLTSEAEMASGLTDANGNFEFALRPGKYVLVHESGRGCYPASLSVPQARPRSLTCQRR
jgi:hypothetical protein